MCVWWGGGGGGAALTSHVAGNSELDQSDGRCHSGMMDSSLILL